MRFGSALFSFLATVSAIASVAASPLGGNVSPLDLGRRSLQSRAVVDGNVCASVDLSITVLSTPYVIAPDICLCTKAGILTPQSVADVRATVQADDGTTLPLVGPILDLLETTIDGLVVELVALGQGEVNNAPATCNYPSEQAGFGYPVCSTSCAFTCLTGYQVCGNNCIPEAQACISGIPSRRDFIPRRCPAGYSACATAVFGTLKSGNTWECLNTATDIESCGGCAFPFPGNKQGEDCTALPGAVNVACVAGECRADSCANGYSLNGNRCEQDATA